MNNLEDRENLYVDLLQLELVFYRSLVKNANYFRECIISVFFSKIKQQSPKKILKALLGTNTN